MKWVSPLFSDARNKIGGTIYARNRAGVYQRARVTPSNPQTAFQQANRAMFSTIVTTWRTLTQAQRLGWNNAAEGSTLTDSLGQTSRPSGFQLYTSCNRNLLLMGRALLADAPPKGTAQLTTGASAGPFTQSRGSMDLMQFDVSPTAETGNFTVIFGATAQLSPGITFVARHLYRTLAVDNYDSNEWDWSSEWGVLFPEAPVTGNQIGSYMRIIETTTGYERARFTFLTTIEDG